MSAPVRHNLTEPVRWSRYSDLTEVQRVECLKSCRDLTGALYDGLDLWAEIQAVEAQELGETVLLGDMAGCGLGRFCRVPPWAAQRSRRRCLLHQVRDRASRISGWGDL